MDARLGHLKFSLLKSPHQPLDIPDACVIKHQPNAFLKTFLPAQEEGMSKYQMSLYLKLLLGLPLPPVHNDNGRCPCGHGLDLLGCHRLNCKKHAGKAYKSGHDLVVTTVAKELRRLGVKVVDNDAQLRKQFAHLTSNKRGDLAIPDTDGDITVYDPINRVHRPEFIIDVKMVSLVNGKGTWAPVINAAKNKAENPGLTQQEKIKIDKHRPFYAVLGYAFLPFVVSCFGSFGPAAVRLMYALADLELRRNDATRTSQGLDPMHDPSARSQFRATCYRQLSARIGHAAAKATVMRMLALPRLPVIPRVPLAELARNRPGPADSCSCLPLSSLSPPLPSYASGSVT